MAINTNLGMGLMKFTFTDEDGDVFAYFRMNPADVKLHDRLRHVEDKLSDLKKRFEGKEDNLETRYELNEAIEDLFCWVFGYNVKESLFGFMSATAVLEDGEHFFEKVLRVVADNAAPEIEKRAKQMQNRMGKYTEAYKS